ncbi:MAG: hypothetical protein M1820_004645 [Bogoriella megaspora]|nr:MAG: hypothetical protein M1820_004645 [Bogoriella megaspora]
MFTTIRLDCSIRIGNLEEPERLGIDEQGCEAIEPDNLAYGQLASGSENDRNVGLELQEKGQERIKSNQPPKELQSAKRLHYCGSEPGKGSQTPSSGSDEVLFTPFNARIPQTDVLYHSLLSIRKHITSLSDDARVLRLSRNEPSGTII